MTTLQLILNQNLYLRDPQTTKLGKKIVRESIEMIDALGFEAFTFKKLALQIESTEASVYRYFENKHKLLVYLITWYWSWLEYRIDFCTQNVKDPRQQLEIAINIVAGNKEHDNSFPNVNEVALFRIVVAESDKTYHTKQVDEDNKDGLFRGFKSLCQKIATYVSAVNPRYEFSHSLVSTVLQAAHQQLFFATHLPSLTELSADTEHIHEKNTEFLKSMIFSCIESR